MALWSGCESSPGPEWAVLDLPYRMLIEVPPLDIGERAADALPASLELDFSSSDFSSLHLPGAVDVGSLQVIRYDPVALGPIPGSRWPYERTAGERASRFLDLSLPWDFPVTNRPGAEPEKTFPRGGYLVNATGEGLRGKLIWDHEQVGTEPSFYAIYFDVLQPGSPPRTSRQGFVGDGSPRREPETDSLTGSLYNSVTVDDWDGDGLQDLLVGMGFGNVLWFRNEGDRKRPFFQQGTYLVDAEGKILDVGFMSAPKVVDWDGDGAKDLLLGVEHPSSVVWYRNEGTNADRKLAYQGLLQADGADLNVPHQPCPEAPHYKKDYSPAVEVVDWDGDGDLDLLLGGYITGYIWFYENVRDHVRGKPLLRFRGPLEADGKPIDTVWGARPSAVDLDQDGDLDLLSGSFGQNLGGGDVTRKFLLYWENVGTRREPRLSSRSVVYDGEEPRDILGQPRPLDWNHDGLTDLVISTMRKIYLLENTGSLDSPKWKVEVLKSSWGLAPLSASQVMDWDGDGRLDLIRSPLDADGSPRVLLNKGKGTQGFFDEPVPLLPEAQTISHPQPYGDPWSYVYLHDFEGDGDLDMLWADGVGHAYLHRNLGTKHQPRFDTRGEPLRHVDGRPIKVGPPVVAVDQVKDFEQMQGSRAGIAAADLNGDGHTDITMGDTFGDVFYYQKMGIRLTQVAPRCSMPADGRLSSEPDRVRGPF